MFSTSALNLNASPGQNSRIMTRDEAIGYRQTLNCNSGLYSELAQKLITHDSGIFELSNGLKINATKIRLLGGGGAEVLGGALITALLHKETSVSQMARNIWGQVFLKDPSANEDKNIMIIAEFSAKLELVKSDRKAMLQIQINGLQEDLTKALKEENPEVLSDVLEDMSLKSRRLDKYGELLKQIAELELPGDRKKILESKIEAITQSIQSSFSLIEAHGNHATSSEEEYKQEVSTKRRDVLSESFSYSVGSRKIKLQVEKALRKELETLLETRRPDNMHIRRLIKKYYASFEAALKEKFSDPYYKGWLKATFFQEYSYFFAVLQYDLRARRDKGCM